MAGSARRSVPDRAAIICPLALLLALIVPLGLTTELHAQQLYKYRGENGEWIFSDRPPVDDQTPEVRELAKGSAPATVDVKHRFVGTTVELFASNGYYAPVEIALEIVSLRGLSFPDPEQPMTWVLPPRSSRNLLQLELLEDGSTPFLEYRFRYIQGDPAARHDPRRPYRLPYAVASQYPVTQAFPEIATHDSIDSYYAVDFAMPVGTDIFAARGGIVFDVASSNFRAGQDIKRDGPAANVVRILHDDGTYAIYAHLNTNSIRVQPGDRVERGDYIADSGNTGYSSGPHLHFVVMRNVGQRVESIPVTFVGATTEPVVPATGQLLTAY